MNLLLRPHQPPEDDLDGLLRAYFQAEMPHPWPALKALPPRSVPASRPVAHTGLWRSRLALAAAVILFVLSSLFLAGRIGNEGKAERDLPDRNPAAGKIDPWDPRLPGAKTEVPFTESIEAGPQGTTFRLEVRPK